MAKTVEAKKKFKGDPPQLSDFAARVRVLERDSIISATAEIGGLLQSAFDQAGHYVYLGWITSEFGWSERSAANYRNVYKFDQELRGENIDLSLLNISLTAIYVLVERAGVDVIRDAVRLAQEGRVVRATVLHLIAEAEASELAEAEAEASENTVDEIAVPRVGNPPSLAPAAHNEITGALICLHASTDDDIIKASRVLDSSTLRRIIDQLEPAYLRRFGEADTLH